ncbi:unnamed protein product [Zymoseptoria tritici ST99CH_1A5]|uniref:Fungal lipase-type domain-containing protein n=3 Tax=Zymoseptoria tritici TaxID=1047171 RepID=A0A1X7RYP1_ZYMT9|nr:unnamed protein product [Zymoseptoria tritici ST99CH_3D7]SMR55141.1 unnamed protein product [Zymoseptoria tritici ST99CH_1E4]SMR57518.1 unnamed protein product [Zymoseptoria tritici ST99CH_3D1]SMY25956.1 unnamed protein product [Zymoseptoria tritici ST99CH_1A5]
MLRSLLSLATLILTAASLQSPLLQHSTGRSVSVALFSELEELARIVDISYCVGLISAGISKPFSCLSRCSDFPQFELVTTWNTGPLLSDSCGYIALDHGKQRIIVAFRGTYSIANTIIDLSTIPQKYVPYPGDDGDGDVTITGAKCTNCSVHMGFYSSWVNTRRSILPDLQQQIFLYPHYALHLVGHSLGGAVAALAGLDLVARGWEPTVTSFGEPRVGNTHLVDYIDETFKIGSNQSVPENDTELKYRRVTHVDDPVPLLPLTEWGYAMHAGEIYISKSSLSPNVADLQHCSGDNDVECIAGQDSSTSKGQSAKRDLLKSVRNEIEDVRTESWGIPSRYKLWELFFAHRDYFWRLGKVDL